MERGGRFERPARLDELLMRYLLEDVRGRGREENIYERALLIDNDVCIEVDTRDTILL